MTFDRHPADARAPRRAARRAGAALFTACALTAAALAGCASPPSRFYTLNPGDTTAAAVANPPWLIELAPVDMPSQVAKNQFVVQRSATQVDMLEQERWASLPGDEVRRALSGDLAQQLGTIDVYGSPHPENVPVYRVSVNVQRFESWPGSHALIDAVWSVRSLRTQNVMTCRSVVNERVGDGYEQLVDGHRRAVQALSDAIATGVRTLSQAGPAVATTTAAGSASRTKAPVGIPCPAAVAAGS
ncbi:PqiC family protein [Paraburkholderia caballeronis]|uniref:PqiC family protein n=1 Tax=Paraburkholderia caballeronis TaxID=416943 RepID=UPI001064F5B1|nr:PqiC family protein [Paraburkholderia caballeronis]TDV18296.1 hypothetical protein C7408_10351 [Paraburkholderia caballeronis]TDV20166.1 hypothetical protein C7406_103390 [Paraburkholderia caballeronis]TDV28383.1 hypothetical protein C7404_103390 [Paraburkholderia caballeronis]